MRDATVVVSGGTKGLGRACALAFGERGYRVLALYAHDAVAAESLKQEFAARNLNGRCLKLDVSQDGFELPQLEPGPLILINNACAPFEPKPFHLVAWSEVEEQWRVGVKGSFQLTHAVLRRMVQDKRGTIVNILSAAMTESPPKGFSSYLIVKNALSGMTKALAAEYGSRGVKVFSISPGFMLTPLTLAWDARLRESSGAPTPPDRVASFLVEKIESGETAGTGEDYRL